MASLTVRYWWIIGALFTLFVSNNLIECLPEKRISHFEQVHRQERKDFGKFPTSGRKSEYLNFAEFDQKERESYVESLLAVDESPDPYVFESTTLPDNPKFYPSIGNGHLAHNIYRDAVYVNGIYSGPLGWSHRAKIPAYFSSNYSIESSTPECTEGMWRHQLDLRTGVFTQFVTFPGVSVTHKIYAHQYYDRLLVTDNFAKTLARWLNGLLEIKRFRVQLLEQTSAEFFSWLIHSSSLVHSECNQLLYSSQYEDESAEVLFERKSGCGICCDEEITIIRENLRSTVSEDLIIETDVAHFGTPGCETGQCWLTSGTIKEREVPEAPLTTFTVYRKFIPELFTLTTSDVRVDNHYVMSVDQINPNAYTNFYEGMRIISSSTPETLLTSHTSAFSNIWAKGTIDVEGDLHLNKVIHGCLYYLYTSLPAHPTLSPPHQFSGLSPGGLPNGANNTDYQGHVFWDMETWMYPPILMFRPDLAKDMLSYRISRIDYALARAAEGGYEGARYPWESAFTGVEVTPDICPACRENQQHITGDIAYAARQYISTTWDLDWLRTKQAGTDFTGLQFITEMARFWQSRPNLNPDTGRYDIEGVMPPDEHAEDVTNSIYTNVGASYAVHFARFAGCLVGDQALIPDSWIEKVQKLAFTYNSNKQYHEEFQGYDEQVENNTTDPRGVKQADVVMLGFPFLWQMPDQVRRNDHLWYESVTHPNGPAMTWGIYSIGWLDLGDYPKADEMFNKAYLSYARDPFKVWTEVQSGDGAVNFITGMGGFLQTIIFGYGGLRLDVTELRFNTARLPPGATRLTLKNLHYLGLEFDLDIDSTTTTVTVVTPSSREMHLVTSFDDTVLGQGVVKSMTHQSFYIRANPIPACRINKPEIDVIYT